MVAVQGVGVKMVEMVEEERGTAGKEKTIGVFIGVFSSTDSVEFTRRECPDPAYSCVRGDFRSDDSHM